MAKTYSPKKVAVSFGPVLFTGFAKGTFVSVEFTSDSFTLDVGSDGEVARIANADQSGTITITLQQTSLTNDLLSQQMNLDRLTNLGTGALFIKDASGRTLVNAAEAWIRKPANVVFADGTSGREWTFDTGRLEVFEGGN